MSFLLINVISILVVYSFSRLCVACSIHLVSESSSHLNMVDQTYNVTTLVCNQLGKLPTYRPMTQLMSLT